MTVITDLSQLDLNKTYSYADYLTWQFDDMVELIKGKIVQMSPAPNVRHQSISTDLRRILANYFWRKKCRLFYAPFDVRLYDRRKSILLNKDIYTVVQPDLCVICNPEFLDKTGCNGAPDWIIEILSRGNSKKEMETKYALYEEAGVREYWIVYPEQRAIHQFVLDENDHYQFKKMYAEDGFVVPELFSDLEVNLIDVFESCGDDD
jgi:Uma2 family endonuclease